MERFAWRDRGHERCEASVWCGWDSNCASANASPDRMPLQQAAFPLVCSVPSLPECTLAFLFLHSSRVFHSATSSPRLSLFPLNHFSSILSVARFLFRFIRRIWLDSHACDCGTHVRATGAAVSACAQAVRSYDRTPASYVRL